MRFDRLALAALFACMLAGTTATGCALGDRKIALRYQPVVEEKVTLDSAVAIVKFQDARKTEEVGEVRNAYGMKLAKVWAKNQDAGAWVANAIAEELTRAGCEVAKYNDAAPADARIAITGTVLEVYVKMYLTYTGTVKVDVSVTKAGVPVLNKEYTGKGGGLAVLLTSGEYEGVLQSAVQDIMKQLIPEIIKAIQ